MEPTTTPAAEAKPTIKLDTTREKLSEGRHEGIGFVFLKKLKDNMFEAVHPLSPCKDYLNDIVYSEATGKPFKAYGLSTKKEGIFSGDRAYLAFSSLGSKYGGDHSSLEVSLLKDNLGNLLKVINDVEKFLGIKDLTDLVEVETNLVLADISKAWVTSTWAISLWAFVARNALYSSGGEAFAELKKSKMDSYDVDDIITQIKLFAEKGLPKQDWEKIPHDCDHIHWNGIKTRRLIDFS